MVLISTWLEWSGMAFRNADAKRGMQQRFHQQKESIREDLRWVLLFKDFGWVWLVTTQFQVSGLCSCQWIKCHKSTLFNSQQTQGYYGDVTTTGWRSAITWWYSPSQAATVSYHFPQLCKQSTHQSLLRSTRSATARHLHTIVNWHTDSTAPSWEALTGPEMEGFQLFLRRKFFSVWKGGSRSLLDPHHEWQI